MKHVHGTPYVCDAKTTTATARCCPSPDKRLNLMCEVSSEHQAGGNNNDQLIRASGFTVQHLR